jgi:hypothetical protein
MTGILFRKPAQMGASANPNGGQKFDIEFKFGPRDSGATQVWLA